MAPANGFSSGQCSHWGNSGGRESKQRRTGWRVMAFRHWTWWPRPVALVVFLTSRQVEKSICNALHSDSLVKLRSSDYKESTWIPPLPTLSVTDLHGSTQISPHDFFLISISDPEYVNEAFQKTLHFHKVGWLARDRLKKNRPNLCSRDSDIMTVSP